MTQILNMEEKKTGAQEGQVSGRGCWLTSPLKKLDLKFGSESAYETYK